MFCRHSFIRSILFYPVFIEKRRTISALFRESIIRRNVFPLLSFDFTNPYMQLYRRIYPDTLFQYRPSNLFLAYVLCSYLLFTLKLISASDFCLLNIFALQRGQLILQQPVSFLSPLNLAPQFGQNKRIKKSFS